jgi:hypothetical protein
VIVIGIICVQGETYPRVNRLPMIGITETNDDKGAQDISKATKGIKTPCIKDVCFYYFLFLPRDI